MRKFLFQISCAVIFLSAIMMSAQTVSAQETLTRSVVRHRDFFVQLNGYSDYLLSDVESLERGKLIGVVLLSPDGFEQHIVFDVETMLPTYTNARILNKEARNFLLDTSISMSEVKKLAGAAKIRAAELKRGWTLYEGKPGKSVIIPESKAPKPSSKTSKIPLVAVAMPAAAVKKSYDNDLANLRKDITEKNEPKVASMSSQEILGKFRADIMEREQKIFSPILANGL